MTLGAKMEYLKSIVSRYKKADRKQKTIILNEFCTNCGYHRKHAIRAIRTFKRFAKPKLKNAIIAKIENIHAAQRKFNFKNKQKLDQKQLHLR